MERKKPQRKSKTFWLSDKALAKLESQPLSQAAFVTQLVRKAAQKGDVPDVLPLPSEGERNRKVLTLPVDVTDFLENHPAGQTRVLDHLISPSKPPSRKKHLSLNDHRRLAGLTQREVAERVSVSTGHYSKLEVGTKPITCKMAQKLALALDIDIDDLEHLHAPVFAGKIISAKREAMGISQVTLAADLESKQPDVSYLEQDVRPLSWKVALKLAVALECDPEDFFRGEMDREAPERPKTGP